MKGNTRQTPQVCIGWKVGQLVLMILGMLVLTGAGIYQVHARYQIIHLGYALDRARFEHQELLERDKRLRLSLATHEDPTMVKRRAEQWLDMKRPEPGDELEVPQPEPERQQPSQDVAPGAEGSAATPTRPIGGAQ